MCADVGTLLSAGALQAHVPAAAAKGDLQALQAALSKQTGQVKVADHDSKTAFHKRHRDCIKELLITGAAHGHVERLHAIMAAGANANAAEARGGAELHLAAAERHVEYLKALELTAGSAGVDMLDMFGRTTLPSSAVDGHADCPHLMMAAGAASSEAGKHVEAAARLAASEGHSSCLKLLLAAGAAFNDDEGTAMLHDAATEGHAHCLQILLAAGFTDGAAGNCCWTAVHCAALRGQDACLKALLAAGAHPGAVDKYGRTALHLAACGGHALCLKALLEAGADIDSANNGGQTSLHMAAAVGHFECLKVLLAAGADINAVNLRGQTALHKAAVLGNVGCVQALLAAGADPVAEDNRGLTAADEAAAIGHLECLQLLETAGGRRGQAALPSNATAAVKPTHHVPMPGWASLAPSSMGAEAAGQPQQAARQAAPTQPPKPAAWPDFAIELDAKDVERLRPGQPLSPPILQLFFRFGSCWLPTAPGAQLIPVARVLCLSAPLTGTTTHLLQACAAHQAAESAWGQHQRALALHGVGTGALPSPVLCCAAASQQQGPGISGCAAAFQGRSDNSAC